MNLPLALNALGWIVWLISIVLACRAERSAKAWSIATWVVGIGAGIQVSCIFAAVWIRLGG